MPKRPGLRDDDVPGRLADLERRLDRLEEQSTSAPKRGEKPKG